MANAGCFLVYLQLVSKLSSLLESHKYFQHPSNFISFFLVLRALGIPARSLTTFNSAHDTDSNMSIDKFYYSDGTQSSTVKTNDSVWNFHVWNDAWMKRPDLGKGDEFTS